MNFKRVKITTTAPPANASFIRQALGEAGAGQLGEYSFCSFSYQGQGRFKPSKNAHPHIGATDSLAEVQEEKIEVVCETAKAKRIVAVLRKAHPYEEPVIEITPLLEESNL